MKTVAERLAERRQLKRRVKQLEKCLKDIDRMVWVRGVELNGHGADNDDNPEWRALCGVLNRIRRTTRKQS
jgi:hypothetical protein